MSRHRRVIARLAIVTLQWLSLTAGLAASIAYSSPSVAGLLSPRIDGSWPFVIAFGAGVLLGVVIRSYAALTLALLAMLLAAAGLFAALLMTPAWDGSVAMTTALRNYAVNQLVVLPLVLALPAALGGLAGIGLRAALGGRGEWLVPEPLDPDSRRHGSWWGT